MVRNGVLLSLSLLAFAGCSGQATNALPGSVEQSVRHRSTHMRASGTYPISHIVIVVQENRSFDNLFQGFPGANTAASGLDSNGNTIPLVATPLNSAWDVLHTHPSFQLEYDNGRMDGFNLAHVQKFGGEQYTGQDFAYAYVPQNQVQPYWNMASQYALSDNTFQSNAGPSFPGHLYLIAAQSAHISENGNKQPWGCDGGTEERAAWINPATGQEVVPGMWPCLDSAQMPNTLASELDTAGLTWRYYAPAEREDFGCNWSPFDAVQAVRYGQEWSTNVIAPETTVLSDIAAGNLANVTWVVPAAKNSDHDGIDGFGGPNWVASVVNAVGQSQFWNSTAVIVTWDDWGGWYDHVPPPQLDTEGLGMRVPLIAISPYAKTGYVSHVQFETASILAFAEEVFGLPAMAPADTRATPLDDLFDFSQNGAKKRFTPIRMTTPLSTVLDDSRTSTVDPDGGAGETDP